MPRAKKVKLDPKTAVKRERFSRLFPARVEKLVKSIEVVENCSNKGNYDWTPDLVQRCWIEIAKRLQLSAKEFGLNLEVKLNGKNVANIDTSKRLNSKSK